MIALLRGVKAKKLEHGHGHLKMDAHYGHSGFLEVQISGSQTISQEYLDFIQDSNQKRQNQKKSLTPV